MDYPNKKFIHNIAQNLCGLCCISYENYTQTVYADESVLIVHPGLSKVVSKIEDFGEVYDRDSFQLLKEMFNNPDEKYAVSLEQKNGSWVELKTKRVKATEFSEEIIVATFQNITEQKIKEKKREESISKFKSDLDVFEYIASHDLKTPLRTIVSFLNLIELELNNDSIDKEKVNEYIKLALSGSENIKKIIHGIEYYLGLKKSKIFAKEIDLNNLMETLSRDNKANYQYVDIEITFDKLPNFYADESHFLTLFDNLIDNGIKFNNEETIKVDIQYSEDRQNHIFNVIDNGIGIKGEYCSLVFEMFKKLNNGTEYTGIGMGLAVCKTIVKKYDGEIGVAKNSDQGTSIYVKIPKKNVFRDTTSLLYHIGKGN